MVSVSVVVVMMMAVIVVMTVAVVMIIMMVVIVVMTVAVMMVVSMVMTVVVMMVMAMLMMVLSATLQVSLLDAVDFYTDVGAGDAALDSRNGFEPDAGYTDRIQFPYTFVFIGNNFQQGRSEHITRSSHAAFKI